MGCAEGQGVAALPSGQDVPYGGGHDRGKRDASSASVRRPWPRAEVLQVCPSETTQVFVIIVNQALRQVSESWVGISESEIHRPRPRCPRVREDVPQAGYDNIPVLRLENIVQQLVDAEATARRRERSQEEHHAPWIGMLDEVSADLLEPPDQVFIQALIFRHRLVCSQEGKSLVGRQHRCRVLRLRRHWR